MAGRRQHGRWRDVNGTSVGVGARVEQAEIDARTGALRARLHARGQVASRAAATRLVVRFDGQNDTVSIRPHLVLVIPG